MNSIYKKWLTVNFILFGMLCLIFMPDYTNNEFPLFTDFITLFIFIPSFFIFIPSIVGQILLFLVENQREKRVNTVFSCLFMFTCYILSYGAYVNIFLNFSGIRYFFLPMTFSIFFLHVLLSYSLKFRWN